MSFFYELCGNIKDNMSKKYLAIILGIVGLIVALITGGWFAAERVGSSKIIEKQEVNRNKIDKTLHEQRSKTFEQQRSNIYELEDKRQEMLRKYSN